MQKSELKVSIIIPTLNEEKYIGKILGGLAEQSFRNFEVLVVDCGSTDKTESIVNTFTNKMDVKFLKSPKRGVSFQRNYGAKNAKYDYFMFIDADCFVGPDFLEKVDLYLARNPKVDMFVTWALPLSKKRIYKAMFYTINIMVMELLKNIRPFIQMGGFNFCKRNIFETLEGYDVNRVVAEDHDLVERAFKHKFVVKLLRKPVIYVSVRRIETEGITNYILNNVRSGYYHFLRGGITEELSKKGKVYYKMEGGTYYKEVKDEIGDLQNKKTEDRV